MEENVYFKSEEVNSNQSQASETVDNLPKFPELFLYSSNTSVLRAGELAQRLKSLDFIAEHLGSVYSTLSEGSQRPAI